MIWKVRKNKIFWKMEEEAQYVSYDTFIAQREYSEKFSQNSCFFWRLENVAGFFYQHQALRTVGSVNSG